MMLEKDLCASLEGFKILPYVCQGGFWMYTRQISKGKL